MINYMCEHYNEFHNLEGAPNCDMPDENMQDISSIQDRIFAMSEPTAPVGELEIACTADLLETPIYVAQTTTNNNFVKYKQHFADSGALSIFLLYSSFGDNSGHYDCLIPTAAVSQEPITNVNGTDTCDETVHQSTPCTSATVHVIDISPLPRFQQSRQSRKTNRKEAEVITSSPYKKKLSSGSNAGNSESQVKKRKADKRQRTSRKTSKKPSQTNQSWFCFMCSETIEEDMIQCQVCFTWVHEECAGTIGRRQKYTCEMCHT
jgi:hypothetical protein